MTKSAKNTAPYSNAALEPLFIGWFDLGDDAKKEELLRIIEIELLVEVEAQMPFIKRIATQNPSVSPEDFIIDVEEYARELALRRRHRDLNEPRGDIPKRLRDYWNNPEKRKAYPNLYNQIRYIVWSVVREAITHNPRWNITLVSLFSGNASDEEMTLLDVLADETAIVDIVDEEPTVDELISLMLEEGEFSEDEIKYIRSQLEWEGSSPLTDAEIERKLGWYQSKAHRVKTRIQKQFEKKLKQLNGGR